MIDFDYSWLQDLKAGDEVVVSSGAGYKTYQLKKVDKITPTQIVVGSSRFRKKDGYLMGNNDSWNTVKLIQANKHMKQSIKIASLRSKIKMKNIDAISEDKILKIAELLGIES